MVIALWSDTGEEDAHKDTTISTRIRETRQELTEKKTEEKEKMQIAYQEYGRILRIKIESNTMKEKEVKRE